MTPFPFHFPEGELRKRAPREAHKHIDALRDELRAKKPSAKRIHEHYHKLSEWDELVATLERWWMDERVQAFIAELTAAGL